MFYNRPEAGMRTLNEDSCVSGYILFHYNILDTVRIEELGPRSLPELQKHGGELVIGSFVTPLEGTPFTHMVVYRFSSEEAAMAYYGSGEIQELSKLRREITEGFAVYVPAYEVD